MELIVTIAVLGIATTLTTLFAISTAKSYKNEKIRNDVIYDVKDVHDFVFSWISSYDATSYEIASVSDTEIVMRDTSTSDEYSCVYAEGKITAEYLSDVKTYDVSALDDVKFNSHDNVIKVTVYFSEKETSFIIYKKTQ